MPEITTIPPPRVPFLDLRTGMVSREWYRYLQLRDITITSTATTLSAGVLGIPGQDGEPGEDGLTIVGPQGPRGIPGLTIPGMDGQDGESEFWLIPPSTTTAAILSQLSLTAQTADIADTTLTSAVGLYRLSYYLLDTTADALAGAVTLNIKFTDNAASRTISSVPVTLTATTGYAQGEVIGRLASGNLTYGVTHTGTFGSAAYALYLTLERI